MELTTLRQPSKCLIQTTMGKWIGEMCCQYTSFLSSFIDTEELMGVMVMMGNPRTEEEVQIMISEEDKNGDGLIDREEFFAMLQKGK